MPVRSNPPPLAASLLRWFLRADDAETIGGDLEESYRLTLAHGGRLRADWWYRRQVASLLYARTLGQAIESSASQKGTFMAGLRQDILYALRSLRKQPSFTLTAITMLALGIGANVAIFSLVHAVLIRPLPFTDPDRLMLVHLRGPDLEAPGTYRNMIWSYPKYQFLREHQRTFESVGAYTGWTWNITGSSAPERITAEMVDAGYLETLGIRPQIGRAFTVEETRSAGSAPLAILAEGLWRRRFGGTADVIGRTIGLNGTPHVIIGVVPAGFRGLSGQAELFVPMTTLPPEALNEKWNHSYTVVGRLKPGVTPAEADTEVRRVGALVDGEFPDPGAGRTFSAGAVRLESERADPLIRRSIVLLFGAVAAVLLIVCINVANLMFVRALGGQREVAIRLALGASRGRVIRQLMTESVLLACISAAVGLGVAYALVSTGAGMLPDLRLVLTSRGQSTGLTRIGLNGLSVDAGVLLFTTVAALVAALLFGLAPAWRASRLDLSESMKSGGQGSVSAAPRGAAIRNIMAVGEIAIALVLLTAAGLLLKSLMHLQATELGFQPEGLTAVRLGLHRPALDGRRASEFFEGLVDRLASRQEVAAVAYGNCPPVSGGCNSTIAVFRDRPPAAKGSEPLVGVFWASPGYFETLGIRLIKGRVFTKTDRVGQPKVVVINQAAARAFWGTQDPIGRRMGVGQGGFYEGAEVVGVVADVRYGEVEKSVSPDVYLPLLQSTRVSGYLFVRGRASTEALVPVIRAEVQAMDPDLPLTDIGTMEDRLADATWRTRMSAWLLGAFAALALFLAALGVYGVMTQGVQQRTREIGVRLALGANRGNILRLIIGRAFGIAIAGIVLGAALALPSMRLLTALLYQVTPGDPLVFSTLALVLLGVALLAGYLPARRAARVDPLRTLRSE